MWRNHHHHHHWNKQLITLGDQNKFPLKMLRLLTILCVAFIHTDFYWKMYLKTCHVSITRCSFLSKGSLRNRVERWKSTKTAACSLAQAKQKGKKLFSSLNCICIAFFKTHACAGNVCSTQNISPLKSDLLIIQQIEEILYIYFFLYLYSIVLISAYKS